MAKEYEVKLVGQPYYGNCKERTYSICFSEPEKGINKETGILLLVAGFGGNINSNVYRKIRNTARFILGNISNGDGFNPDTDAVSGGESAG